MYKTNCYEMHAVSGGGGPVEGKNGMHKDLIYLLFMNPSYTYTNYIS